MTQTWDDDVDEFNTRETLPALPRTPKKPPDPKRQARGRTSRKRGKAFERFVVKRLQDLGDKNAHRRFGDRASADAGTGDGRKLECKSGYGGMKTIHRWLEGQYAVVYEALQDNPGDKKPPPLVFMRLDDFAELLVNQKQRMP